MSHKRQIFKSNILKKLLTEKNSCVSLVHGTRLLALPPFFLNDMKSGILYQLNTLLKKYDRSLGGIVIGYQNIKVLMDENTGIIPIGTSEIEVNISVEFYIFQPKIGSCLEGVINKKSNTHIGCLVHKYFNATILKPEEVLYEDWICKNFNVDDRVIFKVKDLDFTALLPYIEGDYDGAELVKVSSEISGNCNTDEINESMKSDLNKTCQNEVLLSREVCKRTSNLNKDSNKHKSDKKDVKKKEVFIANEVSINNEVEQNNSFTEFKVKKKKKKKEKALTQPVADDCIGTNLECLPSQEMEDEMFYSTQLETSSVPKKMRISFCSPIPSSASFKPDNENATPETPGREPSFQESPNRREKELKKKHKKRKKEKKEESEESPPSKKRKISTDSTCKQEETNKVDEKNSLLEVMMQQLCKQQLDRVREELNMSSSDKESLKEDKKKNKKKEKKSPKDIKSNHQKSQLNGNDDKFVEVKTIFEKLWKEQVEKVKEELRTSERKSLKESKKTKSKEKKQEKEKSKMKASEESKKTTNAQSNSTNGNEKKSEEQSLIDKIYRQEIDRAKAELNKSDTDNVKEKKKKKSSNKQESRKEKPLNSLYNRLLNDARSAIEFSPNSDSKKKKKTSN